MPDRSLFIALPSPISVILYKNTDDRRYGNSKQHAKHGMDSFGETDADEHGEHNGNRRKTDSSVHNERDEEIIFAPLNPVIHDQDEKDGERSKLSQTYKN